MLGNSKHRGVFVWGYNFWYMQAHHSWVQLLQWMSTVHLTFKFKFGFLSFFLCLRQRLKLFIPSNAPLIYLPFIISRQLTVMSSISSGCSLGLVQRSCLGNFSLPFFRVRLPILPSTPPFGFTPLFPWRKFFTHYNA